MKPADLFGRDAEWTQLQKMAGSARPELAFVVGRRRVGKSYLLSRFARAHRGLYYQASRRTEAESLVHLSAAIGAHFGDAALREGVGFPSWESLFRYLRQKAGDDPFVVVLDEFPYLAEASPALPSIVQEAWDHAWAGSRLKLVLSGSYVTAMKRLEEADQPLYGRRTQRIVLAPFAASEVRAFVPTYDALDRLRAYGLFGGLPGNLALLRPERSLGENAAELLLSSSGRLVDDAQHHLDAFLSDATVHYSILDAIASGERTWSGLTKRVGRDGGSLLRPVEWLTDMGIIARVAPATERDPKRSRRAKYRITDPYLRLWYTRIAPLVRRGSIGMADPDMLWEEVIEPGLDDHMGEVFEDECRAFVERGGLGFRPLQVGTWWDASSANEVDVVAEGSGSLWYVGEAKWGEVDGADLGRLRERGRLVQGEAKREAPPELVLFSGKGAFAGSVVDAAGRGEVRLVTGNDIAGDL